MKMIIILSAGKMWFMDLREYLNEIFNKEN